jgi:hypothetical protein
MDFTNFGSRIDCYGWGEDIDTAGDGMNGNLTKGDQRSAHDGRWVIVVKSRVVGPESSV